MGRSISVRSRSAYRSLMEFLDGRMRACSAVGEDALKIVMRGADKR
jgi:hypothetical protein